MREKRKEYKDNSRESRVPVRSSADTDHDIESITEIMDSAIAGFERLIARGAREGLRREAALQDVAGDEAAPDRRRPPGRDRKYHGQALSEFESEPFSLSATESETEFTE